MDKQKYKYVNNNTALWDERRGRITTKNGGWIPGEGVYCYGSSLLEDLIFNASYFEILILNITGKKVERRLAQWLEAAYVCMSWPDSRIWCNQIGSLAGSLRTSPAAGILPGILASDSRMYGPGILPAVTTFMDLALEKVTNGFSIETIINDQCLRPKSKPLVPGYGRPLAYGDERVAAMEKVADELGFVKGEYMKMAYNIQELLYAEYKETLNLGGYIAAFLRDQDFNLKEINRITSVMVLSGVGACYSEAADDVPESFFPLRCEDIDYQGKPPRALPHKQDQNQ